MRFRGSHPPQKYFCNTAHHIATAHLDASQSWKEHRQDVASVFQYLASQAFGKIRNEPKPGCAKEGLCSQKIRNEPKPQAFERLVCRVTTPWREPGDQRGKCGPSSSLKNTKRTQGSRRPKRLPYAKLVPTCGASFSLQHRLQPVDRQLCSQLRRPFTTAGQT